MRISVLGAGNGGCAMAADWTLHGHEVSLYDFKEYGAQIEAINANGGLRVEGALEGFVQLEYAGFDIEKALDRTQLIAIVGPAYSTKAFAELIKPYVKHGQDIVVCPGSIGGAGATLIIYFVVGLF
jgi:opine dehydrogenase